MPTTPSRPWLRWLAIPAMVVIALALLRPWTVRPLHTAPAAAFDPAAYAAREWSRLVEDAARAAVDAATARRSPTSPATAGAPARRSLFVTATGTVTEIDRRSRVGLARLRLADGSLVALQVGPVLRGTALRDAASFIRFNDFANQFEFAAVSNALHDRVLREVVGPIDLDALVGRQVRVLGAATLVGGSAPDAALDIVPIQMVAAEGAR